MISSLQIARKMFAFMEALLPGETVSYGYNVRDVLTSISSPRFSQQLRYAAGAAAPCYNAPSTGRFMTVDPMAEKYPGLSPYIYCAGNPIAYIDHDGMQIFVNIDDMIYYYREIEKGRYGFVDEDGNEYEGDDDFIKSLGNALSKLQSKSVGKWLVDSLISDDRALQVVESYYDAYDVMGTKYTVLWNPHNTHGGPCESQSERGGYDILRPAFIGLGHEFAHAYDKWSGTWDKRAWYFQDLIVHDRTDIFAAISRILFGQNIASR